MKHKRARLGLLVAVVAAGVVVPPAGALPGAVAVPGGPTVTLLTGDTVTVVGGMREVSVRAGAGREHVTFFTEKDERGDVHVVPEDAVSLLTRGKLDPRLFNVTELVRSGYDDRSRLPLIVDHTGPMPRDAGTRVSRELSVVGATAVSVERSGAYWSTARRAEHVWLDGKVRATLDHSVPQIGAPDAWNAGHTGAGATVAVLDTGVDTTHPDLADAVVDARNFTDSDSTDDRSGHGTHVASTITGNGDRYRGVAPDAKLLNGKVLSDNGYGLESWVIAGMEWAAASGADVVNLSLGSPLPSDGTSPQEQAVNRITAETGTLFVIAAGNSGPTAGWIGSPGAADAALTVGAVDRNDELAGFSSRGPRVGDSAIKPDITAPGVDIVAARAANGQEGEPGDSHVAMSGTSMAAPHVAGSAAIVAAQHPDWTAEQLKASLMGSAKPKDGLTVFDQGAGRVDVAKATAATVFTEEGSLSFGLVRWPHTDDQPITKTLTYANTGGAPVTLDLTARIVGQDGSLAPQKMFTITPTRLTLPAGGEASATVTADTRVDGPYGVFQGAITATGEGESVRTPIAIDREIESYDVTLKGIDHSGAPADHYSYRFVPVAQPDRYHPYVYKPLGAVSGEVTLRLPAGEYSYNATVQQQVGEDYRNAVFAEPAFVVSEDTDVVLDAREARPADFTVDNPTARPNGGFFELGRKNEWGELPASVYWPADGSTTLKPSTTSSDDYRFTAEATLMKWNGQSFEGTPYFYRVRHTDNAVPQTLRWHFPDRDLAKVRNELAATVPGSVGGLLGENVPLPSTLIGYYTAGVPWAQMEFVEWAPGPDGERVPVSASRQVEPVTFQCGRTTTVRWGVGVFGPAMAGPGTDIAGRFENVVWIDLPMVVDQGRGRMGHVAQEGTTTLLRDGEVIADSSMSGGPHIIDPVDVGPERAEYTVRASADRSALARLSTQISSEWTFVSEHVAEATVPLPLLTLRYAPNLDDHNAAPAGKRFSIPVYVQRNGSAGSVRTNKPAVEVSYDDGSTWGSAAVEPDGGDWRATVDHPAGAEFVSLRSRVTDNDGNKHRQTIIRAYALR
ncbi:S8 family peptidase [Actinophytocola gossypii]|uniref:S8 family serine peptidase n=1 Tax=Actinophytocola gossypii TaxID=2812003 RepID=A0ABT2JFH8_9PSEU|nr:S8 family serine peptidase [Actinophytocola gossypii]MCT2586618.1 S8 family serine peptidase [Actinophytocola gossypii]